MSTALMHTTTGTIELELFDDDAPKTVENFRKLAGLVHDRRPRSRGRVPPPSRLCSPLQIIPVKRRAFSCVI